CLLVTLATTLTSIGWVLGDRASRRQLAESKVLDALERAKPGLDEGNPWDRSLVSALKEAEAQLHGGWLSPEMRGRVEQLQKDVWMLAELERIELDKALVYNPPFDYSGSAAEYRNAFNAYGIDFARLETETAVDLVQSSAIRKHLTAALLGWLPAPSNRD